MSPKTNIRKSYTPKEVPPIQICSKEATLDHLQENVNKLSIIITGNGNPEKGIARKVALIGERQEVMLDKIDDFKKSIDGYHSEVVLAREAALTAKSAVERYQATIEGEEKGAAKVSSHAQVTFNNIVSIVGTLLVVCGLIITMVLSARERDSIDKKIENLGVPVIVNPRGKATQLPAGDALKFFPKDFGVDSTKNKEAKP